MPRGLPAVGPAVPLGATQELEMAELAGRYAHLASAPGGQRAAGRGASDKDQATTAPKTKRKYKMLHPTVSGGRPRLPPLTRICQGRRPRRNGRAKATTTMATAR